MNFDKVVRYPGYTRLFDRKSGFTLRCGDTLEEDPILSPRYPEILDVEISTIYTG